MHDDFIGAGWAFPLRTDATGSIALVVDEREIEEAIRLVLGTAVGERPMRPEFGCRIHEYVFGPANAATAGQIAYEVRAALERWEPRVDVDDVLVGFDQVAGGHVVRRRALRHQGRQRPAQPGLPVLRHPRARAHGRKHPGTRRTRRGRLIVPVPAPHLDDRSFQQLVDDAKRLVQRRCPEWTDHNVSDPGVTLIEAFAQMVDQLIYRLNRVPERHYVKFLELIGLDLLPPAAARGQVTFWLSAAQPQPVVVRRETEVATPRTDVEDAVVFTTTDMLDIVPCSFSRAAAAPAQGPPVDRTVDLEGPGGFTCFTAVPVVGDALLVGLSNPVPRCAVNLRLDCQVEGVGVDPRRPPLRWEAWAGDHWEACELERDRTGGFNRPGDVVMHVPPTHQASIIARQRAAWLRCRLIDAGDGQAYLHGVSEDPGPQRLHHRGHGRHGQRRGGPRRGPGRLRRNPGPTLPAATDPGRARTGARRPRGTARWGTAGVDQGRALRRVRAPRTGTTCWNRPRVSW